MFQNTLNSPPPKSPSQLTFLFKPNATMNYLDSQCHIYECNHLNPCFSFLKPLLNLYLKDYPTHEGVNSHMALVQVYLLTS